MRSTIATIKYVFIAALLLCLPAKINADQFSLPPVIEQMLDLADVTSTDTVYDLGSGDGRIVAAASKRGATAIGIERDPEIAALSRKNVRGEIRTEDYFLADFSDATVITLYIGNAPACQLKPKLQKLRKGTRIVANSHGICGWAPDKTSGQAILWVVQ